MLRIDQVPKPELRENEKACLVRIKYAGVCGSDIARVFRDGTYSMPLIPGHEFAGIVEQAGPGSPVAIGQPVAVYPLLPCFQCLSCKDASVSAVRELRLLRLQVRRRFQRICKGSLFQPCPGARWCVAGTGCAM